MANVRLRGLPPPEGILPLILQHFYKKFIIFFTLTLHFAKILVDIHKEERY